MLRHKRIAFRRIDLVFVLHRAMVRGLGFSSPTVPALRIGGARVQGTRDISAALDRLEPRRPLFPADPEHRRAVAETEAWGDTGFSRSRAASSGPGSSATALQSPGIWRAPIRRSRWPWPSAPPHRSSSRLPASTRLKIRTCAATWRSCRACSTASTACWTRARSGPRARNAADFQIGTSTALLASMDDVRPLTEGRPVLGARSARGARVPGPAATGLSRLLAARLSKSAPIPSGLARTVRPDIHGSCNSTPAAPCPNARRSRCRRRSRYRGRLRRPSRARARGQRRRSGEGGS